MIFACLAVSIIVMTGLWAISLVLRDSSIVDIWWGVGFVVLAWTAWALAGTGSGSGLLACVLVSIWGLRLSIHLARRNIGKGEDPRYVAMRAKAGSAWPMRSLYMVFWLQGVIMWIVCLPVLATVASGNQAEPLIAIVGSAVFAVGFCFETVGDWQLTKFKADPGNSGKVMNIGLWRYTRHPNYFGDATVWWGLWLIAVSAGAWWTVIGPALINFMLVRVSGKALLEKGMAETRPGYADYVSRTSGFFPLPPKRS